MSDFTEGLGTAIEGGLFARAVEGEKTASPIEDGRFAEQECLNCGTELAGLHCHTCGQKAHLHRTIGAFLHDLLHGALHLDGKTWRTLPLLVRKPGQLTRRYIEGERARFVSPMALFLFSIFLMFAVFQVAGITTPTDLQPQGIDAAQIDEAATTLHERSDAARTELTAQLTQLDPSDPKYAEIEQQLDELDEAEDFIEGAEKFVLAESEDGELKLTGKLTGVDWIDSGLRKWVENPSLMLYKLQANFYKFSWLLIPLSTPFVWLLFAWKRRFKAYDHAIFVTYSLAFMSLLFIVLVLGSMAGLPGAILIPAALLIPPIHLYKQLKLAYGLTRFGAAWRLVLLTIFIVTVLVLFLQVLLLLGLMG
ncbi:DUF3667 domain-containing protein [Altererythrobacter sp. MF3-039]|uniref:DUF3667 domain-containing protein n=1 Tax=Altererythrobacter sp. MF3-039 TaxID=3252901 RepID=UPI00390CBF8A